MGEKNPRVLSPAFSKANVLPLLPQSLTVLSGQGVQSAPQVFFRKTYFPGTNFMS